VAKKNPAAVQLGRLRKQKGTPLSEVGRLGGLARKKALPKEELEASAREAGKASAARLTPDERRERARRAATMRWAEEKKKT
jgi:hypothetical protein